MPCRAAGGRWTPGLGSILNFSARGHGEVIIRCPSTCRRRRGCGRRACPRARASPGLVILKVPPRGRLESDLVYGTLASLWAGLTRLRCNPIATGSVDVGRRDPSHKPNRLRRRPRPLAGPTDAVPQGIRFRTDGPSRTALESPSVAGRGLALDTDLARCALGYVLSRNSAGCVRRRALAVRWRWQHVSSMSRLIYRRRGRRGEWARLATGATQKASRDQPRPIHRRTGPLQLDRSPCQLSSDA
jgi:hypothetical protein